MEHPEASNTDFVRAHNLVNNSDSKEFKRKLEKLDDVDELRGDDLLAKQALVVQPA